jgi:hypothetical protein
MHAVWRAVVLVAALGLGAATRADPPAARNVILVTIDGLRWQEVFGGAEPTLVHPISGGVPDVAKTREQFVRPTAEEGREAILPFFWDVVAKRGAVYGDRGKKNVARVENAQRTSYAGYNEMLAGFVDPRIIDNRPAPNRNVTVLEWLNGRPGFEGRVAAYGAWNRLPAMLNVGRSKLPVVAGWEPIAPFHGAQLTEKERALNEVLARSVRQWPDTCPDGITMAAALEHVAKHRPRVMWIALGDADEWGHVRRYDLYLEAARRSDAFVRELWEKLESMPEYAGKTALLLATDHGRGATAVNWVTHGPRAEGSEGVWLAVMGPGVNARGVVEGGEVTLGQVAATLAAVVAEDYGAAETRAAKALPEAARPQAK